MFEREERRKKGLTEWGDLKVCVCVLYLSLCILSSLNSNWTLAPTVTAVFTFSLHSKFFSSFFSPTAAHSLTHSLTHPFNRLLQGGIKLGRGDNALDVVGGSSSNNNGAGPSAAREAGGSLLFDLTTEDGAFAHACSIEVD